MKVRTLQVSDIIQSKLQYLVIIAEKKKKDKFLKLIGDYGAKGINVVYGKGSMSPSAIASAFGFETGQHKVIITCLLKHEVAKEIIGVLYNDHKFSKPNTGIAFTIPVEGLAF